MTTKRPSPPRPRSLAAIAVLALGCAPAPPAAGPPTASAPAPSVDVPAEAGFVVVGAVVFDGERFREGAVHVVGTTIAGFVEAPPPGAAVVDGRGHTLLPGLIDGHTHIGEERAHLERFVAFGVTTAIDLFGPPSLLAELGASDLAADGLRRAALFGAGNMATAPGGHGTEYGIPVPTLSRPEEAAAFVDARVAEGSQLLKIVYDTATTDATGAPSTMPTLGLETVRALVGAGHARGLAVSVHTGTCDDIRAAAEAGADVIAHGCNLPAGDPLPALLAERRVFLAPSLAVQLRPCGMEYWLALVADAELAARLTPEERERLGRDRGDHTVSCSEGRLRLVAEAARAGVRLVAGPDSPNRRIPVGASLLAEIDLLHGAGATIEQALAAATKNPADAYRLGDRGRIAPGLRADLLLVEGDVRASLRAILRTRKVWKAGALVQPASE